MHEIILQHTWRCDIPFSISRWCNLILACVHILQCCSRPYSRFQFYVTINLSPYSTGKLIIKPETSLFIYVIIATSARQAEPVTVSLWTAGQTTGCREVWESHSFLTKSTGEACIALCSGTCKVSSIRLISTFICVRTYWLGSDQTKLYFRLA